MFACTGGNECYHSQFLEPRVFSKKPVSNFCLRYPRNFVYWALSLRMFLRGPGNKATFYLINDTFQYVFFLYCALSQHTFSMICDWSREKDQLSTIQF